MLDVGEILNNLLLEEEFSELTEDELIKLIVHCYGEGN